MPEVHGIAVRLLYLTGVRVRDVLRLEWHQVDFEAGTVTFWIAKTQQELTQPMIGPVRAVLERLWQRRAEVAKDTERICERVFVNDTGKPFTYGMLRHPWERARTPDTFRLHDCRAACASNLSNAQVSSLAAMGWTSHASLAAHERYITGTLEAVAQQYETWLASQ